MTRAIRALSAIAVGVLCSTAIGNAFAQDTNELDALAQEFVAAAQSGDQASVDDVVCVDWLAGAYVHELAARGRIDTSDADAVAGVRQAYRDHAVAFVNDASRSASLASSDLSRVSESDDGEVLTVLSDDGITANYPITGQGVIGLTFDGRSATVDLPVMKVGDYWCMDPGYPQ